MAKKKQPDYAKAFKEASAARAWRWSDAFLAAGARLMARDQPADVEAPDWWEHFNRVARWTNEVEQARKEYLEGRPAQLQELYNFWLDLRRFHLWR